MRIFGAYFRQSFKSNTVYRMNYLLGLLSTCLQLFITCAIWRTLYAGKGDVNNISYSMVVTNFIISIGLSSAFSFDDFAVQRKVSDGTITIDFLKPIDYRLNLFANNLGVIAFKLLMNFFPILCVAIIFVGMERPSSVLDFCCFLVSILLGFLVLWGISLIVQMTTFWIMNVWSIAVLKNLLITVFSGMAVPLWFMPEGMMQIINCTPFASIYFDSVKIYLGQMEWNAILLSYGKQLVWIVILFLIGNVMWTFGQKRLVVQGG